MSKKAKEYEWLSGRPLAEQAWVRDRPEDWHGRSIQELQKEAPWAAQNKAAALKVFEASAAGPSAPDSGTSSSFADEIDKLWATVGSEVMGHGSAEKLWLLLRSRFGRELVDAHAPAGVFATEAKLAADFVTHKPALQNFFAAHGAENVGKVDKLWAEHGGSKIWTALLAKHGVAKVLQFAPPGSLPAEEEKAKAAELRLTQAAILHKPALKRFFEKHNAENVSKVDELWVKFCGPAIWSRLHTKYGTAAVLECAPSGTFPAEEAQAAQEAKAAAQAAQAAIPFVPPPPGYQGRLYNTVRGLSTTRYGPSDNGGLCWDYGTAPNACTSSFCYGPVKHVDPAVRARRWGAAQPISAAGADLFKAIHDDFDADALAALLAPGSAGPNAFVEFRPLGQSMQAVEAAAALKGCSERGKPPMVLVAIVSHPDFDWAAPQVYEALLSASLACSDSVVYLANHPRMDRAHPRSAFVQVAQASLEEADQQGQVLVELATSTGFDPHGAAGDGGGVTPFSALLERSRGEEATREWLSPAAEALLQLPTFRANAADAKGRPALVVAAAAGAALWLVKLIYAAFPPSNKSLGRAAIDAASDGTVRAWLTKANGAGGPTGLPPWPPAVAAASAPAAEASEEADDGTIAVASAVGNKRRATADPVADSAPATTGSKKGRARK